MLAEEVKSHSNHLCSMNGGKIMSASIMISKKSMDKTDGGYKIISVRMKNELVEKLDAISAETNRSRNEIINLLLISSLESVEIE